MIDLLHLSYAFFFQNFEGTHFFGFIVKCLVDFAKVSNSNHFSNFKIGYFWPLLVFFERFDLIFVYQRTTYRLINLLFQMNPRIHLLNHHLRSFMCVVSFCFYA